MKCIYVLALLSSFLIWSQSVLAVDNIVAIVNKKSTVQRLTSAQVKAIFLGETRFAAPGVLVEISDRDRASEIYREFYSSVASMTPKEVSVHWARKVFTGEAPPPPRIAGDDAEALAWVKSKPEAITYIFEKNANSNVRVVFSLQQK